MRPTPDEIIESARALLRQDIAPGLSPEGVVHLKRVMAALRDGRWNESGFDLLNENDALADLISRCLNEVSSAFPAILARKLQEAAKAHASAPRPRSFDEANERNHALRAALGALIDAMKRKDIVVEPGIENAIIDTLLAMQHARAR